MPDDAAPAAYVRLIEPAVDDLRALLRADPQLVRRVLRKLLLLERDPLAGRPLLGALIGWRKLTVGDRHWRIVWRVTTDDIGATVIEIAEVWAVGARADAEIYEEMADRVAGMVDSPLTKTLEEVIAALGRVGGAVRASTEPQAEPVPPWLTSRLRAQLGMDLAEIAALSPEEAMDLWEAHITRRPEE